MKPTNCFGRLRGTKPGPTPPISKQPPSAPATAAGRTLWRKWSAPSSAIISNSHNHKARALKACILRQTGRCTEALAWIGASLEIDHFNYGCLYEKALISGESADLERIDTLMHGNIENHHELALDYAAAGQWEEARIR